MDKIDADRRSENMRRIRGKNSKPELLLRRAVHAAGFRFRLHRRDLPGTPDLILPRHRLALFMHGCFWHRHAGCHNCTMPSTRVDFWLKKFTANEARDVWVREELRSRGWRVEVIWECEALNSALLSSRLKAILPPRSL